MVKDGEDHNGLQMTHLKNLGYIFQDTKLVGGVEGATSRFVHLEKFSLNCSSSSFAVHVNLLHPQPSLFGFGLF